MKLKTIPAAIGISALLAFTGAQAQIIDYDLLDGSGNKIVDNGSSMDLNNESAGAALTLGPFGAPIAVGDTFDFAYQSFVDLFTGGTPESPTGLVTTFDGGTLGAGEFQVTSVALVEERVQSISYENDRTGDISNDITEILAVSTIGDTINIVARFEQTGDGTISLFYDDAGGTILDRVDGTGYDDGTEIARFTSIADSGASRFAVEVEVISDGAGGLALSEPDQGTGATNQFEFEITAATDFVNSDYLIGFDGEQLIYDLRFTGTQDRNENTGEELPVFTPTAFFVGGSAFYPDTSVSEDDDVLLQVDASVQLSTKQIPEPSIIALLSMGLFGVGFMSRRRRVNKS